MRECKQSDVQALEVVLGALDEFCIELTAIRAKLNHLKSDLKKYITEQQEPINVQTTHGLSTDEQRN